MRTIRLVGVMKNKAICYLAHRCAWCRRWDSAMDMIAAHNGAQVSDGMCRSCAKKWLAEANPTEAA